MSAELVPSDDESARPAPRPTAPRQRVDLCAGAGIGDEVSDGPSGFGVWRTVPGFDSAKLRVSASGHVQVRTGAGGWAAPTLGTRQHGNTPPGQTYRMISVSNVTYLVHLLVCRAFHGPKPAPKYECCHDGTVNTEDNRAEILRWVPRCQGGSAFGRNVGVPLLVHHPDHTGGEWKSFPSSIAVQRAFSSLDAHNVRVALRQETPLRNGFSIRHDSVGVESQDDLPAEGELPAEAWRDHPIFESIRLSNRDRIQIRNPRSQTSWGLKRTPRLCYKYKGAITMLAGKRYSVAALRDEAFAAA